MWKVRRPLGWASKNRSMLSKRMSSRVCQKRICEEVNWFNFLLQTNKNTKLNSSELCDISRGNRRNFLRPPPSSPYPLVFQLNLERERRLWTACSIGRFLNLRFVGFDVPALLLLDGEDYPPQEAWQAPMNEEADSCKPAVWCNWILIPSEFALIQLVSSY